MPPLSRGVACIPGWLELVLRHMQTREIPTSRFTQALTEASLDELEREREQVEAGIATLERHLALVNMAIEWKRIASLPADGEANGTQTGKKNLSDAIVYVLNEA